MYREFADNLRQTALVQTCRRTTTTQGNNSSFLQQGFADTPPQISFHPVATDRITRRLACFTLGLKVV